MKKLKTKTAAYDMHKKVAHSLRKKETERRAKNQALSLFLNYDLVYKISYFKQQIFVGIL